jgi:hypothetical protein
MSSEGPRQRPYAPPDPYHFVLLAEKCSISFKQRACVNQSNGVWMEELTAHAKIPLDLSAAYQ